MDNRGRKKEKSQYVSALSQLLNDVHPELTTALTKMKSQHLILLANSIRNKYHPDKTLGDLGCCFPVQTDSQKLRFYNTLNKNEKGNENESGTISSRSVTDNQVL